MPGVERADLERALAELRDAWGVQFTLVAPVLRELASAGAAPVPVERLVLSSGLSHRSTLDVLRRLEPWLRASGSGDAHRLAAAARPAVEAAVGCVGRPAVDEAGLLAAVTRLAAGAPSRRRALDHVVATPETVVARARHLVSSYALDSARVLFLGDHDLTSLAVALAAPSARVSVVDVDDSLLAYLDRSARGLERRVACHFADLRLELPRPLRESADLVFTDPPYTPEGARLFAARGCEALRRDDRSRLLLCHGFGERQAGLGLKVQSGLHALRLVHEAILPRFNRYLGAQAIGSASALHVLRPSAATWRALEREPEAPAGIYTHGGAAVEARPAPVPAPVEEAVRARLEELGGGRLVGSGWAGASGALSMSALWRLNERHATAAPAHRPALPPALVVNLADRPALAVRLLLTNRTARLLLVLPRWSARSLLGGEPWLARLLGAAYSLRPVDVGTGAAAGAGLTVVDAAARDRPEDGASPEDALARDVVRHPAGAVGNVLREALVRAAAAAGRPLTRNEARSLVAAHVDLEGHESSRAADLPLHALRDLAEALPRLAAALSERA